MSEQHSGLLSGWWTALIQLRQVSAERRQQVLRDIHEGSIPSATYYSLLGISEVIAGFALMIDSDATLIGANVVAPLMTPIIGMSLGLLRGDVGLLYRAVLAEFGGALFGVMLCFALGRLPLMDEPTALLLSQTKPTLIDLFVASLAGFAGVLAMIDERVSPALPGVAIATALNPPIAAIGLCLASGAYQGAFGAFLLFFANVLAILAVGAVVFFVAGFVTRAEVGSWRGLARRFSVAVISLTLVAIVLTGYLFTLIDDLRVHRVVNSVLDEQLARLPNTALTSLELNPTTTGVSVIASVDTPQVLEPQTVKVLEEHLSAQLGRPVQLFMRCKVTKDISATGSTNIRPYLSLDGKVSHVPLTPPMAMLQQAEQIAREALAEMKYVHLDDIRLVELDSGPVLVIAIQGPRQPRAEKIAEFQKLLQERLQNSKIRVDIRRISTSEVSAKGPVILGAAHYGALAEEQQQMQAQIESLLTRLIMDKPNFYVQAIDAAPAGEAWTVRGLVAGAKVLSPADIKALQDAVKRELNQQVDLKILSHVELEVGEEGYQSPPIR